MVGKVAAAAALRVLAWCLWRRRRFESGYVRPNQKLAGNPGYDINPCGPSVLDDADWRADGAAGFCRFCFSLPFACLVLDRKRWLGTATRKKERRSNNSRA